MNLPDSDLRLLTGSIVLLAAAFGALAWYFCVAPGAWAQYRFGGLLVGVLGLGGGALSLWDAVCRTRQSMISGLMPSVVMFAGLVAIYTALAHF
ncbi:hypothetical protein PWP93_33335 [Paraburkholderia sp. A1RI-2L]|uniref:hypothetical protein n=1 Tax=Paraburkholderia sp. A1RI-2L TaxID=3028367 RepID=UPI003B7A356A